MKNTSWFHIGFFVVACWLLTDLPCRAETKAPPPPDSAATLQAELARINQTLSQLVVLLRDTKDRQSVDVLLKRIELHYLDLTPIQEDLRSARSEKRSLEEEQIRLLNILDEWDKQAELGDTEIAASVAERAAMRRGVETQGKFLKGRLANVDQRIAELESDLADRRRKIEELEGTVDNRVREWGR